MVSLVESREEFDKWLYAPVDGWEAADSRLLSGIASAPDTEGGVD